MGIFGADVSEELDGPGRQDWAPTLVQPGQSLVNLFDNLNILFTGIGIGVGIDGIGEQCSDHIQDPSFGTPR